MIIKKETGATTVDIAISIIVITVFIALIGNLVLNINANSTSTQRKTIATSYAVQEIERIKNQGFTPLMNKGINAPYVTEEDILDSEDNFTGYHKKVTIKDYVLIKNDNTKESNLVKQVIVEISYKIQNSEKSISISTYISKE